ncbi:MAG: alanine racemase [Notoacmeibacter sp.]
MSDASLAGGRLTIDLGALVANYHYLSAEIGSAEAGVTIKADAYGLGMPECAPMLWQAGARSFFVALASEGVALRAILPKANIYVLHGATLANAAILRDQLIVPVLGSLDMISLWRELGNGAPCALHVDTGMNRLGLTLDEAKALHSKGLRGLNAILLMTHFACADDRDHPKNTSQIDSFNLAKALFPQLKTSLQNSAGAFLGNRARSDVARLGISLYGGEAVNDVVNPMQPVVKAEAQVMMVRHARAGETVSYGATQMLTRDTNIAVCSVGYADGYHRALSGTGVALRQTERPAGFGFINGHKVPILGRVTMDQTIFDVTDGPDVEAGDFVELFGPNIALDEAARAAGTIGYEMLTSLGQRYFRKYVNT